MRAALPRLLFPLCNVPYAFRTVADTPTLEKDGFAAADFRTRLPSSEDIFQFCRTPQPVSGCTTEFLPAQPQAGGKVPEPMGSGGGLDARVLTQLVSYLKSLSLIFSKAILEWHSQALLFHTEARSEQSRQQPGLPLRTKGALPPSSRPSGASRVSAHGPRRGTPGVTPHPAPGAAPLRARHAAPRRPAAPSPAGRPGRTHPAPPGRLSAAARVGAASPPSPPRSSPGPATRTCSWCGRPARGPGAAWRGRERSKPITRKNRASFSSRHSAAATAPPCWHRHVTRAGSPPSRGGLRPLRGAGGGSGRGGPRRRSGRRRFEESLRIKFQVPAIQSSWPIVSSYVQLFLFPLRIDPAAGGLELEDP